MTQAVTKELPQSVWGVQQLFVRPGDGMEYQLAACQEASISAQATIAELMGDDSLVPLDTQPKKKSMTVKAKHGRVSLKLVNLMTGGTYVQQGSSAIGSPVQESDGGSMLAALSVQAGGLGLLQTDTFTFQALDASTYTVTPSSTGIPSAVLSVSSYPNTTLIPGVSFVVNGTLAVGSIASVSTTASGDFLETGVQAKNDFAAKVGVRCITENLPGQGQLEFIMPLCQSSGIQVPLKTKDWALIDAEFTVLFDAVLGKSLIVRRYDRRS